MGHRAGSANHMELVHRPGEAHLVAKVFDLLGLEPKALQGSFEGTTYQYSNDLILWCSPVVKDQWEFEQWLQRQIEEHGDAVTAAYIEMGNFRPQKLGHFGIGIPSLDEWEATVARVQDAAENDPELRGRISVPHVSRPEEAHSVNALTEGGMGPRLWQGFMRTDIFSSGLLTIGQTIEIQYMTAYDPAYAEQNLAAEPIG